jgi:exopolyphosphatase / guanosine-5'-triphosphate,3'-diphosphate pyrophosphatase
MLRKDARMIHKVDSLVVMEFGSNSCKIMQIGKGETKPYQDYRLPLRLAAEKMTSGELSETAIEQILHTIREVQTSFAESSDMIVVGTEALRRASNRRDIMDRIRNSTGLELKILSSKEEGEAAFRGIHSGLDLEGRAVCFDIGGASTEIVIGSNGVIEKNLSFPLGAVTLTQRFRRHDPLSNCEFFGIEEEISRTLLLKPRQGISLVGTGGSILTCAMVALGLRDWEEDKVNGYPLARSELYRQIQTYRALDSETITKIPGMDPTRADIILPAAMIMLKLMDIYQQRYILASSRGVRHGLASLM